MKRCRLCGRGYASAGAHMEECQGPDPAWLKRIADTTVQWESAAVLIALANWHRNELRGSV